ncbi:MAG: hypothetical protein RSB99_03910, partial [Bacilli bacterium]
NGIRLTNLLPQSDTVGKALVGNNQVFDFQVVGTTQGAPITYEVIAEKGVSSTLNENVAKIYLTTVSGLTETPVSTTVKDNKVTTYNQLVNTKAKGQVGKTIYQSVVPINQTNYTKLFRLRMWVSDEAIGSANGEWNYNNKTFSVKVNVIANALDKGAIIPTPTPTLIPTPTPTPIPTPVPTPTPTPVPQGRIDIAKMSDLVGINYSVWFNYMQNNTGGSIYNVSNILGGTGSFGPVGAFHYWAEPALGYYKSTNKAVIRNHMTLLADAGVDFIILDNTNPRSNWIGGTGALDPSTPFYQIVVEPTKAILDTIVAMRLEGLKTPYVLNWMSTDDGWTLTNVFQNLFYNTYDESGLAALGYNKAAYRDIFVHWVGLPFMLTTTEIRNPDNDLNYRKMWGLQPTVKPGEWSYLQRNNANNLGTNYDGSFEQMSVSVAMQQTRMSNTGTALGRRGGNTFYEQWSRAFASRPKYLTLSWWNEWGAERIAATEPACTTYCFTDNYNQEYSRDIEPMKGGHGNTYYLRMKEYIKAYKNHQPVPKLVD